MSSPPTRSVKMPPSDILFSPCRTSFSMRAEKRKAPSREGAGLMKNGNQLNPLARESSCDAPVSLHSYLFSSTSHILRQYEQFPVKDGIRRDHFEHPELPRFPFHVRYLAARFFQDE